MRVFRNYEDFLENKNSNENGVSQYHLDKYYNGDLELAKKDNGSNIDCYNCYNCNDCNECYKCYNCNDCNECNECEYCYYCDYCEIGTKGAYIIGMTTNNNRRADNESQSN